MVATLSNNPRINQLIEELWKPRDGITPFVYALLDGAKDKQIEKMLRNTELHYSCLYQGKMSFNLLRSAPHLVRLEKDHKETLPLLEAAWGNHWGIFAIVWPPAYSHEIRHDFRKVTKIKTPNNKTAVFRFYDPRVLRIFLPSCNAEQAQQVFGSIEDFVTEGENEADIHRFRRTENGVVDIYGDDLAFKSPTPDIPLDYDALKQLLKIQPEQINVFEKLRLKKFYQKSEQYLQKHFPRQAKALRNRGDKSGWIERNVTQAMNAGLTNEQAIFRYINVAVFHGENVIEQPWAKKVLDQPLGQNTRAAELENESIAQLKARRESLQLSKKERNERKLSRFCEDNQSKLMVQGEAFYNLHFDSEEQAKEWLYLAGEASIEHKLTKKLEMDLWLDLSMRHGLTFYEHDWALKGLAPNASPQERLQHYLSQQPHTQHAQ